MKGPVSMWKNLRNLVFSGVASKVLLGLSNVFLIKVLAKSDFALLSNFLFIQSMVSGLLFSPFLLAAVPIANLKKIQNYNRFFSALNWFQMSFLTLLFLTAFAYGPNLSLLLFKKPEFHSSILIGLAASIVLTFQNIMLSQQQTKEAYARYNFMGFIRPASLLFVLLILYYSGTLNFWTAAFSFLFSIGFSLLVDLKSFSALFHVKGFRLRITQLSWFWKSAWMLILFFFIRGTYDHVGFFFVSRYFDLDSIANFSVPFRYYAMADLIVVTSHIPFINSFTKDPPSESFGKYMKWVRYTALVAVAGLLVLPFSKEIFVLISGEKYEVSFPYFCIFMVGLVPYFCFSPGIYGVIARGGGKLLFWGSLAVLLVHIAICGIGASLGRLEIISASVVFARGIIYIFSFLYLLRKT